MKLTNFYLEIARNSLTQLIAVKGGISIGDNDQSEHFSHAVSATVFSAISVEYGINEFIWVNDFLCSSSPNREQTEQLAKSNIPEKIKYLKANGFKQEILKVIRVLFERRNRLVHLRHQDVSATDTYGLDFDDVIKINKAGRAAELDKANELAFSHNDRAAFNQLAEEFGTKHTLIQLPGLNTELIPESHENVGIAQAALEIILEKQSSAIKAIPRE